MPARIGLPPGTSGMPEEMDSAEYAPVLSLLHYAARVRQQRVTREVTPSTRWRELFAWSR